MNRVGDLAARYSSELGRRDATLPEALVCALQAVVESGGTTALDRHGRGVANRAVDLATRAPAMAAAFLGAIPGVLAHLSSADLDAWAGQAGIIDQGTRKSASLAARWLGEAPVLLGLVPLSVTARIAAIAGRLAAASNDAAATCVDNVARLLAGLDAEEREPFVLLAETLASAAWPDAVLAFERTPDLVATVGPGDRARLLALAAAVTTRPGAFAKFAASVEGLSAISPDRHAELLDGALLLAEDHDDAALAFLASAPRLVAMLSPEQFRHWYEVGIRLLDDERHAASIATYFRLESSLASDTLALLSPRVELALVGETLRLYAQALTGRPVQVRSARVLVERGIGWAVTDAATTEGTAVYLPPHIDRFADRDANTRAYKVCVTHQAGRLEFGSFDYRYGVDGSHLPSTEADRAGRRGAARIPDHGAQVPEMHRYYALFEDRALATGLFSLVEDARIDARIAVEYPGVRSARREVHDHEVRRRPDVLGLGLRDVFAENLLRWSLGRADTVRWPEPFSATMARGLALLRIVTLAGATVQDTAEVTARLYDLAAGVANVNAKTLVTTWVPITDDAIAVALEGPDPEPIDITAVRALGSSTFQVPYAAPPAPDFRGDFKPELVQTLTALNDAPPGPPRGDLVMTAEQLRDLLASSPEIQLVDVGDDAESDAESIAAQLIALDEPTEDAVVEAEDVEDVIEWSWYDEWDFRANDYRHQWCRVGERPAAVGDGDYYEQTLLLQHALVIETRRQFEMMRPESFRRMRRLEDGHEIDFDEAIEFHADRRAGIGPIARFYSRRDKVERDVAVAFLLDLSGSTDDPVDDRGPGADRLAGSSAPRTSTGAAVRKRTKRSEGAKRVIDVEKEAAVLLVEALEAIGDTYALYGFSGYGRQNCEFHVIKDLDDPCDEKVRGRIGALAPRRSTRMGPAIRHAAEKLRLRDAKIKLLVLVSDGRPQDHAYGRDREDTDYAVHDTKQALVEARRAGVVPFLITVDVEGDDYLHDMCEDFGYEVVADVESLPRRLPALYRHLAT